MIQVIYRGILHPDQEAFFKEAWEELTRNMLEKASGSHGMVLLRNQENPREFLVTSRWDSFEEWRTFWASDLTRTERVRQMFLSAGKVTTEIFEEIENLTR
jgi:heme-degrading monooxygenase HmoA